MALQTLHAEWRRHRGAHHDDGGLPAHAVGDEQIESGCARAGVFGFDGASRWVPSRNLPHTCKADGSILPGKDCVEGFELLRLKPILSAASYPPLRLRSGQALAKKREDEALTVS